MINCFLSMAIWLAIGFAFLIALKLLNSSKPVMYATTGFFVTRALLITMLFDSYTNAILDFVFKTFLVIMIVVYSIIQILVIKKTKVKFEGRQIISFSLGINLIKNLFEGNKKKIGVIVPYSSHGVKLGGLNIPLPTANTKSGSIVTGSSGSGKSFFVKNLIKQDISEGRSIVYFDFKGEKSSYKEMKNIAIKNGYEFYGNIDSEDSYFFDPLETLSQEGRVEAIMNTRKWDVSGADSHYKINLQRLVNNYIKQFDKIVENGRSSGKIGDSFCYTKVFKNFIEQNKPDLSNIDTKNAYNSLLTILSLILESGFGDSLSDPSKRKYDPRGIKQMLYISISSDSKELANSYSSFYFRNILYQSTEESFDCGNGGLMIYIDEAASANPINYKDLMEKGRSGGLNSMLIMQDIHQMDIETSEAYTNSLLGTAVNFFIFAGATKAAALRISGVQSVEIETAIQNLTRPPEVSALFITKQPVIQKNKASEFYKFKPYVDGVKQISIGNIGDISKGMLEESKTLFNKQEDNYNPDIDLPEEKSIKVELDFKKEEKKKKDDHFFDSIEDDMIDKLF